ncbi:MAG: hypothetical protein U0905_01020 [Pirellulales bacterium]
MLRTDSEILEDRLAGGSVSGLSEKGCRSRRTQKVQDSVADRIAALTQDLNRIQGDLARQNRR